MIISLLLHYYYISITLVLHHYYAQVQELSWPLSPVIEVIGDRAVIGDR